MNPFKTFFIFGIALFFIGCSRDPNASSKTSKDQVLRLLNHGNDKNLKAEERLQFVDSAYRYIPTIRLDSLSLAVVSAKSNLHYRLKQLDSTSYYDRDLLKKALKAKNFYYQGKAYLNIAFHFRDNNRYDSAFYYFNQSKNAFQSINHGEQVGRRLLSMGILQHDQSDFFGSKETLTEALQYLEREESKKYIASAYNELATNHKKLLNYEDALSYYEKAITASPTTKDQQVYTNNLATVYIDKGNYKKAQEVLKLLISNAKIEKGSITYARILDNLAYAEWHLQKPAKENLLVGLAIRKAQKDARGQIASFTHLAEVYANSNRDIAVRYLDTVVQLSKQLKMPKAEQDALTLLMSIAPNNISAKKRYIVLQDSLFQNSLKVKTQFAKLKYDDQVKQQAILKLKAETAINNAQLAQQRLQKILLLAIGAFLALTAIVYVIYMRRRHHKEKKEQIYTTEKRISKKVHDELANDIYGVMSNIQHAQNFNPELVLDTLEDIYERTRDISQQTGGINTQQYIETLKLLFSRYKHAKTTITMKGLNEINWNKIHDLKKIALYRVLNELLVNMKKYSEAELVVFDFKQEKQSIKVDYRDNGKGLRMPLRTTGGLVNAENRMKSIGGTFKFDTKPKKGVQVTCSFPI